MVEIPPVTIKEPAALYRFAFDTDRVSFLFSERMLEHPLFLFVCFVFFRYMNILFHYTYTFLCFVGITEVLSNCRFPRDKLFKS